MSKNLTRKGLAIGALIALGTSVIAGAPAQAAGELNVAPKTGTSYNTIAGAVYTLATTFAPGYAPAAYGQLKYLVKTDANSAVSYGVNRDATNAAVTSPNTALAVSTTSAAVAGDATAATDVSYLALVAQTTTVSSSVEVTAFVDANNDGALTSGEWNTVRTVNFKKAADITPAVTLTAPSTGDTTVKATVVWGDLNIEQLTNETIQFTTTQQTTAAAGSLADGVWSLSRNALAAADVVTAQAYIGSTALGTAVSGTAAARTINTTNGLVANVLAGNDAVATAATTLTSTNATVRVDGSFTAQVKAFDTATTPVAKSGVAVVATVATTNTSLRPASTGVTEISVTVNGTKYTTNATLAAASVALTTDASGLASVVVSSTGLTAGTDTVTVSFKAQNLTAAVVAAQTAATYTLAETTASGSSLRSIAEGGSTTLNYTVKDQFGVAMTGGRLVSTVGYSTSATVYTNLVGGAGSLTVTDTTASTATTIAVSTTVETQNATTLNWAAASPAISASTQTVYVASQADAFDFAPAAASAAIAANATITGSVRNAGSAVVVSATGVTFTVNSKEYADTVTIVTGANGDFSFTAKSNTAGEKTITFTNTEVKTAVLTVAAAAASTGATLTINAPVSSVPGRTVPVSVVLVDQYGNPVDTAAADGLLTVTVSGIGTYSAVADNSDASGKISFNVILPSNDSGVVTISAKYDSNGATADVAGTTVVLSKTATITVAAAAAVEPTSKIGTANSRVYVNVKDGKGSVVSVKIGAKWFTRSALNNDYTLSFKAAKGKKVSVKVYVDGDLSSSKTITVK